MRPSTLTSLALGLALTATSLPAVQASVSSEQVMVTGGAAPAITAVTAVTAVKDKGDKGSGDKRVPTGKLRVKVKKSPQAAAKVSITGSDGFSARTAKSITLRELAVGRYSIRAEKTRAPGGKVMVSVSQKNVRVRKGHKSKVRVAYRYKARPVKPTTLDVTPPAPVSNLNVGQVTDASVAMSWRNPGNGDLSEVIVRRAQGDSPPSSPSDGVAVSLRSPTAEWAVDEGLTPGTSYTYSVFTRDTGGNVNPAGTSAPARTATQPTGDQVAFAVGDIADCELGALADTSSLLAAISTTEPLLGLGDMEQTDGTPEKFRDCYEPFFGRFKERTWAVPGNHEYNSGAVGYFDYFGPRLGTENNPWYSVDIGEWHFAMLNSNCWAVGGCQPKSRQYQWLKRDLAAHPRRCLAAVWHQPMYSSGDNAEGNRGQVSPLWRLLMDYGADLLLVGHQHSYERFPRLDDAGTRTPAGIRQIIVGTGGAPLRSFRSRSPQSEFRQNDSHGLLRLRLGAGNYSWSFLPTVVDGPRDSGSDSC